MKKIYLLAFSGLFISSALLAQTPCDAGRYSSDMFSVTVTSAVNFGNNTTFTGGNMVLNMDIYEPTGDIESARPLIIWAHGGSFIGGSRTDPDVVTLADAFAQKGFVCASIDYRTGMWPIDSVNSIKAVLRAVQDMKGATRFFYKDRATTNTYKIDTNLIFIGGSSAGAITALHMAYLDKECEIEEYIPIATVNSMGGIEGTSGSPGYSSKSVAVINLAGALASYGWIESGDVPVCSLHGTVDGTVPYNRGIASVSGFQIMYLDGSRMIDEQCGVLGIQSNFYSHYTADHAPYAASAQYMDTTINFVRDFTIDILGCTDAPLQPENAPLQVANLYPLTHCGLGISSIGNSLVESIYPNPSYDQMMVTFADNENISKVTLSDMTGRVVRRFDSPSDHLLINKNELISGTYVLKTESKNGAITIAKIMFQ